MIAIYSQMLDRKYKGKLSPQADEYITHIVQGARRMEMLLKDLLVYAKTINAPVENVAPVDVNAVVAKALSNLCAAAEESKATIVYQGLPTVKVHEVHLLQLFQNLIGNAIKYRSEEPPRIEVSAEREGSSWSICVKDNGIGIPPEYQEQIFRMFKRLHNAEEYEGTGMGLAICQRIVERYGGHIWVESEKGKGSKFCFTAPAANGKAHATGA
jgi:light-regulated signal transduction histidine kinase (bacteriophytochrome)